MLWKFPNFHHTVKGSFTNCSINVFITYKAQQKQAVQHFQK